MKMERYFLLDEDDNKTIILDQIFTDSQEEAETHFVQKGWVVGNVISETNWNNEINENLLN